MLEPSISNRGTFGEDSSRIALTFSGLTAKGRGASTFPTTPSSSSRIRCRYCDGNPRSFVELRGTVVLGRHALRDRPLLVRAASAMKIRWDLLEFKNGTEITSRIGRSVGGECKLPVTVVDNAYAIDI